MHGCICGMLPSFCSQMLQKIQVITSVGADVDDECNFALSKQESLITRTVAQRDILMYRNIQIWQLKM